MEIIVNLQIDLGYMCHVLAESELVLEKKFLNVDKDILKNLLLWQNLHIAKYKNAFQ